MSKSNKVSIENFANEISSVLMMYSNNVSDASSKWVESSAKKTAKNVKKYARTAISRMGKVGRKYVNGWVAKKDGYKWVVHNKDQYRLAHLLENGHDIVRNGRVVGHSSARPHISQAEHELLDMVKDLEKKLEEVKV